jgi:hypothetical protein
VYRFDTSLSVNVVPIVTNAYCLVVGDSTNPPPLIQFLAAKNKSPFGRAVEVTDEFPRDVEFL